MSAPSGRDGGSSGDEAAPPAAPDPPAPTAGGGRESRDAFSTRGLPAPRTDLGSGSGSDQLAGAATAASDISGGDSLAPDAGTILVIATFAAWLVIGATLLYISSRTHS